MLTRPSYQVWLNPVTDLETPDFTVAITTGDQMRAELESRRIGLPGPAEAPLNSTAVWIWCAMVREGHTQAKCQAFLATELGEWQPAPPTEVDPTPAEPSDSA